MYEMAPFKYTRSSSNPLKAYGKEWTGLKYPWDLLEVNVNFKGRKSESAEMKNARIDESNGPVFIGANVSVKDSEIRGPAWIGRNGTIGPDALVRRGSIGEGCKVGKSVEVKNSVIMKNTNVPHLSYVGDSILGKDVNLAAGTKIANLRYDNKDVHVETEDGRINTGRRKMGALIGDYVKSGIDTRIYQGSVLGPFSFALPGSEVKGYLPPFRLKRSEEIEKVGVKMVKSSFPSKEKKIDELWDRICVE